MISKLMAGGRTIRREVESRHFGPLVIRLAPEGVYVREKGRRTSFLVGYGSIYRHGVTLEMEARKRERRKAKRARRGRGSQ